MQTVDEYLSTLKGFISLDDYLRDPNLAVNRVLYLTSRDTWNLHKKKCKISPTHVKLHPKCTSNSLKVLNCETLLHLDVSHTQVEYIPSVFKSLVYLDISHTSVIFVKKTPSIHILRMAHSKVIKYQRTSNVRHLDASNTPLSSLANIKRLEELNINNTSIPYLPRYPNLRALCAKNTEYLDLTENIWKLDYVDLTNSLSELFLYKFIDE